MTRHKVKIKWKYMGNFYFKILVAYSDLLLHILSFTKQALFNQLPDDKILDWSKLKQIADDILKSI